MAGFFQKSELLVSKAPTSRIPKCGACGLYKSCQSPKMPVAGKGKRRVLIVGEAPGAEEDKRSKPFVGPTGQLLQKTLGRFGIDMFQDCWITNSLICRPPNNAAPTDAQIGYCRPNLIKAIEQLQPEMIIPLGGPAVTSLIGWLWKDDVKSISRWIGWHIPHQKLNAWVCPAWHPSFVARADAKGKKNPVVEVIWNKHLKNACELIDRGRPWQEVPNYKKDVKLLLSPQQAKEGIDYFLNSELPVAFDYETNMLKPDWHDARIICASMSNGQRTIAFPFHDQLIGKWIEFLQSPVKKIASNLKFEDRWSRVICKSRVNGWWWDTMNEAHIIDNRPDITSIKFQAFVLLGAESYDDHIKRFLKSKGDSRVNQILKDVDIMQLLTYCGMDSLLEWLVCFEQRKIRGFHG